MVRAGAHLLLVHVPIVAGLHVRAGLDALAHGRTVKDAIGTPFSVRSTNILPMVIVESKRVVAASPTPGLHEGCRFAAPLHLRGMMIRCRSKFIGHDTS